MAVKAIRMFIMVFYAESTLAKITVPDVLYRPTDAVTLVIVEVSASHKI